MRAGARKRLVATFIATLAVTALGFSVAHASGESDVATLDGQLLVGHGDDFQGHTMAMGAEMRTAHGTVRLKIPANKHKQFMLLSGKHVKVRGQAAAPGTFAAESVSGTADATAAAPRPMRIAFVLLHTKGSTAEPYSAADVQKYVFNTGSTIRTVADYYAEVSGGQVAVTGGVFGYYNGTYVVPAGCPSLDSALSGYLGDGAA